MYLSRLELSGFKTFAKATSFDFPSPKEGRFPVTAIVGPNGSGKSNIADAIRWCLGEQSTKLLRGENQADLIFAGSLGKHRSNFCQVSLTFNNEDRALPNLPEEVAMSRRLDRDGSSEYFLHGESVRLFDIQMLLAEVGVGQRSYSVIGQGMVDSVLLAAPIERKDFFDDALGIRGIQIKRKQTENSLSKTRDNLLLIKQIEEEIGPRLQSLTKLRAKFEARERLEREYKAASGDYYSHRLGGLDFEINGFKGEIQILDQALTEQTKVEEEFNQKLQSLREAVPQKNDNNSAWDQERLSISQDKQRLSALERARGEKKQKEAVLMVEKRQKWTPWPLQTILEKLRGILELADVQTIKLNVLHLISKLTAPETHDSDWDPVMLAEIRAIEREINELDEEIKIKEEKIHLRVKNAQMASSDLLKFQDQAKEAREKAGELREKIKKIELNLMRAETERIGVEGECAQDSFSDIKISELRKVGLNQEKTKEILVSEGAILRRMRQELERIGEIDGGVVVEQRELYERQQQLESEITDVERSVVALSQLLKELTQEIGARSDEGLRTLSLEFDRYFKRLFNGGTARLEEFKVEADPDQTEEEGGDESRKNAVTGVEIIVAPPNKKAGSLLLLSGGERALTALALLAAIMATNPSPFVVLDEVDAALDEANTARLTAILQDLSMQTQFILITHNQSTMELAHELYGVSLNQQGMSEVISLNLVQAVNAVTTKAK